MNIHSPASPPRHYLSLLFNASKIRRVWRHSFPENFEILSPRKRDFRYEYIAFKIDCVFIVYFYKFLTLAVLILSVRSNPPTPPAPTRLDPPQLQYGRTSTINAPGGADIQEVCRLGLQTLTLFEVQLFILLPCLRQQSLFYVPDSFRSHSGLNNFQTNITK